LTVDTVRRELAHEDALAWIYWYPMSKYVEIEAKPAAPIALYKSAMSKVLEVAKQKGVRKLLTNAEELDKLSADDMVWTEAHWAPEAIKLGITHIAVVIPKTIGSYLVIEKMAQTFPPVIKEGFEERFFADAKQAREWLETQ
jgi:hypothetical protein